MEALERVRAVVSGDAAAWSALMRDAAPEIAAIARAHPDLRSRGLAGNVDDVNEVVTATLERLAQHDFKNLRRYLAQCEMVDAQRAQSFDSWLYGAVDFTIREHLRQRFGRAPKSVPLEDSTRARPSKRDLHTGATQLEGEGLERVLAESLGMTAQLTLREVLDYVAVSFTAQEASALRLYYEESQSFAEIAATLGLEDEQAADKLIRRLNARLRYRFGGA
jgi:DNA-directed RNA polymerase specialized sigma24 family protein